MKINLILIDNWMGEGVRLPDRCKMRGTQRERETEIENSERKRVRDRKVVRERGERQKEGRRKKAREEEMGGRKSERKGEIKREKRKKKLSGGEGIDYRTSGLCLPLAGESSSQWGGFLHRRQIACGF